MLPPLGALILYVHDISKTNELYEIYYVGRDWPNEEVFTFGEKSESYFGLYKKEKNPEFLEMPLVKVCGLPSAF